MPEGIAVEIENGYATIAPEPHKINEVVSALLEHTPAEAIETNTRSGPSIQYVVPVGNALAAGLIDAESLTSPVLNQVDLGPAADLQAADPNAHGDVDWHHPVQTVDSNVYVNGRDGANGAISGPLHHAGPADSVPEVPSVADETSAELQARIKTNTPRPADYAPKKSTPFDQRVPTGTATIANVVTAGPEIIEAREIEIDTTGVKSYDDGEPDNDWPRAAVDEYARGKGLDPTQYKNKPALLKAIKELKG